MGETFNLIHEGAHEEDPTAAWVEQVFRVERVWQKFHIETRATILHINDQLIAIHPEPYINRLALIALIAMLYGIDDGLAHCQLYPSDGILAETHALGYSFGRKTNFLDQLITAVNLHVEDFGFQRRLAPEQWAKIFVRRGHNARNCVT
jgi:hypothetical protein